MSKIRAILFVIYFLVSVAIIIVLMYLFNKQNRAIRRVWAKSVLKTFGIKIQTSGNRDNSANFLIMNHQSMLDIILLEAIENDNLCWIAKSEIKKIPLYGHILNAPKMIEVDREDKKGLIKLLKDVKDRLANNRVICMFPEGTRSDGAKLLKFKSGARVIAEKFDLKVQPIVIIGAISGLNSKKLTQNATTVKIVYLDSFIPNKEDEWYIKTHQKMEEALKKELNGN
jgi:1-acyl-sn-glycerol-3-phosphate acyltransferase